MSPQPPNRNLQAPLAETFAQLGLASLDAGLEMWNQAWGITSRYLQQSGANALHAATSTSDSSDFLQIATRSYRQCTMELAMVPTLAIEQLGIDLGNRDLSREGVLAHPVYDIDGKPVMLPVRVGDAAQGSMTYAVSAQRVQRALDEAEAPFRVLDIGHGQTALEIFIVDYRQSDLGHYYELGIVFIVTPQSDPAAMPGLFMTALPVNLDFSCRAGRDIWGYPKELYDLDFVYETDLVRFTLCDNQKPLLCVTLPRGGTSASTSVPVCTYTLLNGRPHLTVFTRSGRQERIQAGGRREALWLAPEADIQRKDDFVGKALQLLHQLKLTEQSPIRHTWTEHMSGTFGIPDPVTPTMVSG